MHVRYTYCIFHYPSKIMDGYHFIYYLPSQHIPHDQSVENCKCFIIGLDDIK